jgi:hypothetical protein
MHDDSESPIIGMPPGATTLAGWPVIAQAVCHAGFFDRTASSAYNVGFTFVN